MYIINKIIILYKKLLQKTEKLLRCTSLSYESVCQVFDRWDNSNMPEFINSYPLQASLYGRSDVWT